MHEHVRLELFCCPIDDAPQAAFEFPELLGEAEDCLDDVAVKVCADVV